MTKEKHKNPYGLKDSEFRHLEDWQCDRQFCDEFIKFTEPGLFSCGHVWVCWAHRGSDTTPINIEDFRCEECHKISRFINADENGRVICSHCEHKDKLDAKKQINPYGLMDNEFIYLGDWHCEQMYCDNIATFIEGVLFHPLSCNWHKGKDATPINIEDFHLSTLSLHLKP